MNSSKLRKVGLYSILPMIALVALASFAFAGSNSPWNSPPKGAVNCDFVQKKGWICNHKTGVCKKKKSSSCTQDCKKKKDGTITRVRCSTGAGTGGW